METFSEKQQKNLLDRILKRVDHIEQRRQNVHMILYAFGTLGSILMFVAFMPFFIETVSESGFATLLSLVFTDAGSIVSNLNNYLFSLLETVPVVSIIVVSCLALTFILSLQAILRDIKLISKPYSLIPRP